MHDQTRQPGNQLTKGERTRSKILDAAAGLFAQQGYDRTSLRDVAALVGIQEPGIYRYFETKDALYSCVLELGLQPLVDHFDNLFSRQTDPKAIGALPAEMFGLLCAHPQTARLLANAMAAPQSAAARQPVERWLARLLEQGQRVMSLSGFGDDPRLSLFIVNMFNVSIGFFSSDSLFDLLGETRNSADPALRELQQQFVATMARAWAESFPTISESNT